MKFSGGLPETRCGAGSKMENTAQARAILPQVIAELKIKSLLDAPCGDFNGNYIDDSLFRQPSVLNTEISS
jgi:hypothetical protein